MRLIDAEALIDWLTKATGFRTNCEDCTEIDCLDCIIEEAIENAPTIEAKPVVHAHWVRTSDEDDLYLFYVCSHCGEKVSSFTPYCPYCSAQMDKSFSRGHENDGGVKIPVFSLSDLPKIVDEERKNEL